MNENYVQQVAGDHYQAEYQHWDWVMDIHMNYLEGCATKYVLRWPKKNGLVDLKKSITYLEKARKGKELLCYGNQCLVHHSMKEIHEKTDKFCSINKLGPVETEIMNLVAGWQYPGDLSIVIGMVRGLIVRSEMLQKAPETPAATTTPGTPSTRVSDPLRTSPDGRGPSTSQAPAKPGLDHPAPFGYEGDD